MSIIYELVTVYRLFCNFQNVTQIMKYLYSRNFRCNRCPYYLHNKSINIKIKRSYVCNL